MQMGFLPPEFSAALEEYKHGYMAFRNLAQSSRCMYEIDVRQLLSHLFSLGLVALNAIEQKYVEDYLVSLDAKGLEGVTRRRKLIVIQTFFEWLTNNGAISHNPAKRIIPPQQGDKEPRVLSKAEYERLLSVVQKPRDRAIIQLILQTGIRLSECQRLRLGDLELPKRATKDSLGLVRILAKGRKARTVLLNFKVCETLLAWLAIRPNLPTDALFTSGFKRPLSQRQLQRMVSNYYMKAGISGAAVHTLRHTFATHHVIQGTDLSTVKEFLGHESLETTSIYIGLAKKRQAVHIQEHAL